MPSEYTVDLRRALTVKMNTHSGTTAGYRHDSAGITEGPLLYRIENTCTLSTQVRKKTSIQQHEYKPNNDNLNKVAADVDISSPAFPPPQGTTCSPHNQDIVRIYTRFGA